MLRRLFVNQFLHLRALWRIVIYLVIAAVLITATRWLLGFLTFPDEGDALLTWKEFAGRGGFSLVLIAAAFIVLRWIDRRPLMLLGMHFLKPWKRDFVIGLAIGVGGISVTLCMLWAGGWMTVSLNDLTPQLFAGITKAILLFFVAALMEELMLRGYVLQAFIEGARVWIAVILLSSVFSIMHFDNPDATITSSINIFLAGVLLSVCYLKTRSLWLPTGLHLGWNWMQASFWGMGVSGFHVQWSVFSADAMGADWISGGKFGAEASIFATIVVAAGTYFIWTSKKLGVADELKTAWSAYPRGYGIPPQSTSG